MLRFASLISVALLLTSSVITAQPTVDLNEWETKFAHFQDQVQQLVAQNTQLKNDVDQLKTDAYQAKTLEATQEAQNQQLKQQVEQLTSRLNNLKDVSATAVENRVSNYDEIQSRAIPTNCSMLGSMGHRASGLYMIKGADSRIHTYHCELDPTNGAYVSEQWIGYNDIKTTSVYFHATRKSAFSETGKTIPYETLNINLGGAMVVGGTFTVPKNGTYSVAMTGLGMSGSTRVYLYVNGKSTEYSAFAINKFSTYAMQGIVKLAAGDKVTTHLTEGSVGDGGGYTNTHFTGMLIEEDLIA